MQDPTVAGEFEYVLRWFEKNGDDCIGEEDIPALTPQTVRNWFGIGDDECPVECYHVCSRHVSELNQLVTHLVELNRYDYFIEAEQK